MLEQKQVTIVAAYRPIGDPIARRHCPWWQPENYGECSAFQLTTNTGSITLQLSGYLFSTPTNSLLFLQIIQGGA